MIRFLSKIYKFGKGQFHLEYKFALSFFLNISSILSCTLFFIELDKKGIHAALSMPSFYTLIVLLFWFLFALFTSKHKKFYIAPLIWFILTLVLQHRTLWLQAYYNKTTPIHPSNYLPENSSKKCGYIPFGIKEKFGVQKAVYIDNKSNWKHRVLLNNKKKLTGGETICFEAEPKSWLPASNEGQWDAQAYYEKLNIQSQFKVEQIEIIQEAAWLYQWAHQFKNYLSNTLKKSISPQQYQLAMAITLGDKQHLETSLQKEFQASGLAHLMAVSGLHAGFVGGIALIILIAFPFTY